MNPLTIIASLLVASLSAEYFKCELPVTEFDDVSVPIKSCGKGDSVVFQLNNLKPQEKVEFRIGRVSAALPVTVDMEVLTEAAMSTGLLQKLSDKVKAVFSGNPNDEVLPFSTYTDVEKISFVAVEPTMYVRVTADFAGEVRPDLSQDRDLKCGPLKASFICEKVYFGVLPFTSMIMIGTSMGVLLFFWLIGMPLMAWALGPQVTDETKKAEAEKKTN